jgi:hypothetical protein
MSRRILRSSPGPMSWPLWTGTVVRRPSGCPNCRWLPLDFAQQAKSHPLQGSNQVARLQDGQLGRAHTETSTRWTPMISGCFGMRLLLAFKSSRHKAMTSLMFSITSS